jgi:hypothetical protein
VVLQVSTIPTPAGFIEIPTSSAEHSLKKRAGAVLPYGDLAARQNKKPGRNCFNYKYLVSVNCKADLQRVYHIANIRCNNQASTMSESTEHSESASLCASVSGRGTGE